MIRVGFVIVSIAVLAALLGPVLTPYDPAAQDLARRLEAPSLAHPFGLDELGRDILARILSGAQISLLVGLAVVSVSSIVGMLVGSVAGYFGGRVDDVISRIIDVLMAFPGILLAIALVAVLGPSLTNVVIALSVIGWVGYARLVRGQALRAREFDFVQAARALGAGSRRIVVRHILPTALPAVVVQATLGMAGAIIAEAVAEFSRPRRAASHTELGHDARRRPVAPLRRASPDDLSRPGDRRAGARLQLPWRRSARSSRSEVGEVGRPFRSGVRVRASVADSITPDLKVGPTRGRHLPLQLQRGR